MFVWYLYILFYRQEHNTAGIVLKPLTVQKVARATSTTHMSDPDTSDEVDLALGLQSLQRLEDLVQVIGQCHMYLGTGGRKTSSDTVLLQCHPYTTS